MTELDSTGLYLADLDKVESLNATQRLGAYHMMKTSNDPVVAQCAHRALWTDACKFVVVIEGRIRKAYGIEHADPDMIQEGNLAAGKACETWDPEQGAFSTWIGRVVSGAMLDYLNESNKGGVGSKSADVTMVDMHDIVSTGAETTGTEDRPGMRAGAAGVSRGEMLTYSGVYVGEDVQGSENIPEGYDTPDKEAYKEQLREALEQIRDPLDRIILTSYYGFDGPAKTLEELAKEHDYSITGIRKRLLAAQEKVKKWL